MNKILDTRDLQKRLEELESDYDDLKVAVDDAEEEIQDIKEEEEPDPESLTFAEETLQTAREALLEFETSDEFKEMEELHNMSEEIYSWTDGETLIPVDDWEDYVQELLKDTGYIADDFPWWIEIDWTKTADNVAQDYSTIDYQGETYYYRSSQRRVTLRRKLSVKILED